MTDFLIKILLYSHRRAHAIFIMHFLPSSPQNLFPRAFRAAMSVTNSVPALLDFTKKNSGLLKRRALVTRNGQNLKALGKICTFPPFLPSAFLSSHSALVQVPYKSECIKQKV